MLLLPMFIEQHYYYKTIRTIIMIEQEQYKKVTGKNTKC